ncbi:MAG: DUF4091 domain-containing protein [Clostridia bacterium]|nr:DUF4091 domain-containing protein [Clostridia bacterium]
MSKKSALSVLLAVALLFSTILACSSIATDVQTSYAADGFSLWFDYASEKTEQSDITDTGMDTFTVYMAKNEIENAQFFISSRTDMSDLDITVDTLSDTNGNTIDTEVFVEYYHNCDEYGSIPDAIPPLSAYGPVDLTANKSQGFIIKLKTTETTVAGDYSAAVTVHTGDGELLASTTVYAHVWDFALSEETACASSIWLSYSCLENIHETDLTGDQLYKIYYDYLLENRINAAQLPVSVSSSRSREYLDNPRVTSYQLSSYGGMTGSYLTDMQIQQAFKNNFKGTALESRFDKAFYFSGVVDADERYPERIDQLKEVYDEISPKYAQYTDIPVNFINTFYTDLDYTLDDGTVIDQIDFYDDFVNLWCVKPFAFTTYKELATVPGAKIMQPQKWDSVYGTFSERMAGYQERGDKVWWFVAWDVKAPYVNYYMQTDGVAQRLLFWQQYDQGVEGFLYNFVNYWAYGTEDPYTNNITDSKHPDGHGASILLYPGDVYGIDAPVGSLRLEAMRDGIEDYQLFHMLDELKGKGAADEFIHEMTTGVATYSTDDSAYYLTRKALGDKIEAVVNGTSDVLSGDVDGDGEVTMLDLFSLKLFIKQKDTPTEAEILAGDIDGDGEITMVDSFELKYRISKGYWRE